MGLAAPRGPERSGHRGDRLLGTPGAPDGLSRVPGAGLVHWQRCGGERLQHGGGAAPEVGGDAVGRDRLACRLPPPRPVPQRERAVGGLLESELHPQLIACTTNYCDAHRKARGLVENFGDQWLQLRLLSMIKPDPAQFPTFDDDLRRSMVEETRLYFASLLQEDR